MDTRTALFVYGTLRSPELLAAVLGHVAVGVEAVARNHRTVPYPGRTYPALTEAFGRDAHGLLLTSLTAEDFALLDVFEGDEYARRAIKVRVDARLRSAQVYWPLKQIPADAPDWHYEAWQARFGAGMIAGEGAAALRERLIAEGNGS